MKMKKILTCMALVAFLALASCGSKDCRCYEFVNGRWTGPHTTLTADGTPCSSLNSVSMLCNEMDDPILNPGDIGVDTKKK